MNFGFRKLRKITSSIVVSGILACSGGSCANGLSANSINTVAFGALTTCFGLFAGICTFCPNVADVPCEQSGQYALISALCTMICGLQTRSAWITTDMQDWFVEMKKNEKINKEKIEQIQACMNNYRDALLNNGYQSVGNVNYAMVQQPPMAQQSPMPVYNGFPQDVRVANNMQQGRYNF